MYRREMTMKKIINKNAPKLLSVLASLALILTTVNVNSACWYVMGQEKLPEGSKGLRKFD